MKTLITLFSLFICSHVGAQTFTPEDALQKFSKYPQERIYVKFDKDDYLAGETMHFKAYIFSKFTLSLISTNLYFEYLDKNKKIIYKNILPVYSGIAEGSFHIPKQLLEDVYYFRAYTSWMLNFDERFQYLKPINIYNPSSATKLVAQPAEWFATIHPEGGKLLDNTSSNVAVRLHSVGTLPQHCTGYLFDNTDSSKKIAAIDFLNNEIGSLNFIPMYGKKYNIKITDATNRNKIISLPKVMEQGLALSTKILADGIQYTISSKGITDQLKGCKIIAQNQGELIYSALIKNQSDVVTSTIPLDSLTKGIVQVTIFDAKGNPAAERLCFVAPKKISIEPDLQFAKRSSIPKGPNEWMVDVDTITTYTYFVEVSNSNSHDGQEFLNTFWLSELSSHDLKNEYLNTTSPESANALDLLMMSEKWGKFEWNDFLNNPVPKLKYIPDNFLTWKGQVLHRKKPLVNEKIGMVIQMPDSSKIFVPVKTDGEGNFIIKNIDFRDTAKVLFRINNLNNADKDINIVFTRIDESKPYQGTLPQSAFTVAARSANDPVPQKIKDYASVLNTFENDDRYKKLESVVIKAKGKNIKDELNKKLSSPMFREPGEIVFDFMNENKDEASGGIIDWLNGKVPGLTVEGDVAYMRGQAVRIYINEFIADYTQLSSYPPTEIAMVKVLRTPFMLGSGAPVIAVYTKTADMFKPEMATFKSEKISGYPSIEKFKTVDYSDSKFSGNEHDAREVLYWNTRLNPEKNKQTIRFNNNDVSKTYHLIIIGFRKNSTPVYLDKVISF